MAEIEEEWVIPVDTALEAAGGLVLRRTRAAVAQAQCDHDVAVPKSGMKELDVEASSAPGAAWATFQSQLARAKTRLDGAVHRAQNEVETLTHEADAKADSLKLQLSQAQANVKFRVEDHMKRTWSAYHARGAKRSQAWGLAREALTA